MHSGPPTTLCAPRAPKAHCARNAPRSDAFRTTADVRAGSALTSPRFGASHRLLDYSLRDHMQLGVLGLTHPDEPAEGPFCAGTGPAPDDADRLVDDRSAAAGSDSLADSRVQRVLQLFRVCASVGQQLRVADRHRSSPGKSRTQPHRVLAERVAAIGISA